MEAIKKKGKPPVTQVTLIFAVMIVAIVGYYCYLVNRNTGDAAEVKLSAAQNVLLRNLEKDYPPSPKEVVKYYNEIMKCFYNEECSEEEINDLAMQARGLYDQELLDNNELGRYLISLKSEIKDFKDNKRKMTNFSVAASADVDYFKADGFQFAKIRSGYNVMQGKDTFSSILVYLLRKDSDGHWKIYGWESAED